MLMTIPFLQLLLPVSIEFSLEAIFLRFLQNGARVGDGDFL
jgi:hypothetical protein